MGYFSERKFTDKGRSVKAEAIACAELYEKRALRTKEKNPDWNWNGWTGPWTYTTKEQFIKDQIKRIKHNRKLRKNWPKGKQKMQVVLEHIKRYPTGLKIQDIRQFVWEMNGYKGKSPRYYWMSILQNPDDISHGKRKISLLDGWCDYDEVTEKYRLKKGVVIKPPFLKDDMENRVTAGDYRRIIGRDPRLDGIRLHRKGLDGLGCSCPIPDEYIIDKYSIPNQFWDMLGFVPSKNDQYHMTYPY